MSLPKGILELSGTLERFKRSSAYGVPGVMKIGDHAAGPILGITACTHGDEPAGLAVFKHLLEELDIQRSLLKGTLYLVVNNLQAAQNYFEGDGSADAQYCDFNMNRMSRDILNLPKSRLYEGRRACELSPVWRRFSAALDVQGTSGTSRPVIMSRGEQLPIALLRGFPLHTLVSNKDRVQWGTPAFSLYGNRSDAAMLAIEAGRNDDPAALENAKVCAVALLQNLGMIEGVPIASELRYNEYVIREQLLFNDTSWSFVRPFETFDPVTAGEPIAKSTSGRSLSAPMTGHLLFPTKKIGDQIDPSDEAGFFSEPVKKHVIAT